MNRDQVFHLGLIPFLLLFLSQGFFIDGIREGEEASSSLNVGQKLLHHVVGIQDAKLDDPSWLEEKNWSCDESKNGNA